jgi:hypothetical protein
MLWEVEREISLVRENIWKQMTKKNGKWSLDQNSVDRNCVLLLDRNYVNHLTKFFDIFHLIEICNHDFGQLPKSISSFLAVDQKF